MSELFVIAEDELVLAFRLVGADGKGVAGRQEALDAFLKVTGQAIFFDASPYSSRGVKILILSEEVSEMLSDEVREWQLGGGFPLIVEIPGLAGSRAGRKGLVDSIREAVGIRV